MNKEECIEALNYMHCPIYNTMVEEMSMDLLRQLIDEHFENPPLEFEALTFSNPYWYEEENCWCFLTSINKDIKTGVGILLEGRFPTMKAINFKENHFFAREVKEDV